MVNAIFIISERFVVDVERSEVLDRATNEKSRLEPRLMKLLNLLAAQQGKVLKREFIIKEIWDDYPGASEGLNQAISFLRKLLADEHKAMIQTQPKSGYIFHGTISTNNKRKLVLNKKFVPVAIAACVLTLLLLSLFVLVRKNGAENKGPNLNEKKGAELSRMDSVHQAEQLKRYSQQDALGRRAKGDTLGKAAKGDSLRSK